MIRAKRFALFCTGTLVVCAFLQGCVSLSAPSGGLRISLEAEQMFVSGNLLPDHTYYTEGPNNNPDAIIAVSNAFQLQTELWSRRDWDVKGLKDAVFWMQSDEYGFCTTDGGVLIAPDGQQVGIWYSKRTIGAVRQITPTVIEIYPFMYSVGSECARQNFLDSL